jgi:hypothetical protein
MEAMINSPSWFRQLPGLLNWLPVMAGKEHKQGWQPAYFFCEGSLDTSRSDTVSPSSW